MTYPEFKEIVDLFIINSQKIRKSYDIGIDLIEFTDTHSTLTTKLLSAIFTTEGLNWFEWFMYEKNYIEDGVGRADINAYSTDIVTGERTEIVTTLDELYEYLLENNYIKCKTEL